MRRQDGRGRGGQRVDEIEREPGENHHEDKGSDDCAARGAIVLGAVLGRCLGGRYFFPHLLDIVHFANPQLSGAAILSGNSAIGESIFRWDTPLSSYPARS